MAAMRPAGAGVTLRTVHVFVALADNEHQGIVPVPAKLGNGEDPEHNLYWGSAYGVKTFFHAFRGLGTDSLWREAEGRNS